VERANKAINAGQADRSQLEAVGVHHRREAGDVSDMKQAGEPPVSLDSIARDPALVRDLGAEVVGALIVRVAAVLATLSTAAAVAPTTRSADDGERLLSAAAVAQLSGFSKRWVEKHLEDLPPRRSVAGQPRWLRSEIEKWMRSRARYGNGGSLR
jgi:predicted DNA-binding transcriptional regulator AlpA